MAKRFTENMKWEDGWFRKLRPLAKLFWLFIVDKCDIAGFWEIDWELASFYIGEQVDESILSDFDGRLEQVNNNGKIWITKFVFFQYGCLNPAVHMHASVIKLLEKKGLLDRVKGLITLPEGLVKGSGRVKEGLVKGSGRVKDRDRDKYMFLDKEGDTQGEEKENGDIVASPERFDELWKVYPNKDGKKEAFRHFERSMKTAQDWIDIQIAMKNYLKSENVRAGYIKKGATWFNNWRDWVDFAGVQVKTQPSPRLPRFDEDTEFQCGRCGEIKKKTEREYDEDSQGICLPCFRILEAEKKEGKLHFQKQWESLSPEGKAEQIEMRIKLGLPILDWMKEEVADNEEQIKRVREKFENDKN